MDTEEAVTKDVMADRLRLSQVLMNILSNAVKYTPAGGTIEFRIVEKPADSDDRARFEFRVKDDGIGMSEEFQKTIFEAFTREKTSTVSGIQGTGLGMAISKSIVDMMGGTIAVSSVEGEGSEFVVDVEFARCDKVEEEPESPVDLEKLAGKRVLLAEDNELNQQIALAILEEAGFVVDIAVNGEQAVEQIESAQAGHYDLVLMDVQMPVMDGYEATKRIRALDDAGKASVPIVAMTANAFEEDRQDAFEAGMNDHLAKPYDVSKMMRTISNVLR